MDSHDIISNLSKDIFILEDESNPLTSNVSRIYPKTIIDQVYDVSDDEDIKNLRQIIAELREDIQSTGSGVIPFPVRSVNGLTGDVVITKALLGLDNVDNTSDNEKQLSPLQLRSVITILDNYGITDPGNFNTLFNNAIDVHNVSATAHSDIRNSITNHNLSNTAHSDIRGSIDSSISIHNSSNVAHDDIRSSISTAVSNHNSSNMAHDDIRSAISSNVSTHNSSNTAHSDIRNDISGIISNISTEISTHNSSNTAHSDIRAMATSVFPCRTASTTYAIGDIVMVGGTLKRLECVVAGTTDSGAIGTTTVGQLVVDGTVTWIVDNFFDPPVGTFIFSYTVPSGWIKIQGGLCVRANYPRLWSWAVVNDLVLNNSYWVNAYPGKFWYPNDSEFYLPNIQSMYIRSGNNIGTYFKPEIPNLLGYFGFKIPGSSVYTMANNGNGPFSIGNETSTTRTTGIQTGTTDSFKIEMKFDASSYNSVYTNTNTVQPPSIELYPIMKY